MSLPHFCNDSSVFLQSLYAVVLRPHIQHMLSASTTQRQDMGLGTDVKDTPLAGLSHEVEFEVKVISLLPVSSSPQCEGGHSPFIFSILFKFL